MEYILSKHAGHVVDERRIKQEWLEDVLDNPQWREADPLDDALEHRLGVVREYGDRVLRVVVAAQENPIRVITVYFDRSMKGKI